MTPSPEALARAIDVLKVRNIVAVAEHLDAFARERAQVWADPVNRHLAEVVGELVMARREKREAVEAVLRALPTVFRAETDAAYFAEVAQQKMADALDHLAQRPVGTTLARVRK